MQNERQDFDDDDLAEIWRSAQRRRAKEIYSWLTHFLNKRRQLKSTGGRPQHAQGHASALGTARRTNSTFGTFRARGLP
jgi:hypothetical protein